MAAFLAAVSGLAGHRALAQDQSIPDQSGAVTDISIDNPVAQIVNRGSARALLYFSVVNHSDRVHLINGVSADSCEKLLNFHPAQSNTELTETLFNHLAISGNSQMVFPPGAFHLVCFNATRELHEGEMIKATFSFLGGTSKVVNFTARSQSLIK